jgi:uncharacterized protein YukE
MTDIRVNPDMLEWGANEFAPLVKKLNSIGAVLHLTSWYGDIDSQYIGQLAGVFRSEGANALADARHCSHEVSEISLWLREMGRRFEEVDQAALAGMERLLQLNQAFIAEYGDSPLVPQYLINGTRPPWIPIEAWREMNWATRKMIIDAVRADWARFLANRTPGSFRHAAYDADYLEEMFMIYMFGLPASHFDPRTEQQREPYYPVNALYSKPELPDGTEAYPDRLFTKYQYQDLEAYLSDLEEKGILDDIGLSEVLDEIKTTNWSRAHYNLCGLDSAGFAVGVDYMVEAYVAFANIDEPMLIKNETTWTYQIRDLYREMGWEAEQIGRFASTEHTTWLHWDENNRLSYPTFEQVEAKLQEGYVITPLVGVDSATGYLTSNENAATGHFINIIETTKTRDGTELLRVYNSMHHREEIYTWDVFDNIWQHAGGNSGGQAAIARPPEVTP